MRLLCLFNASTTEVDAADRLEGLSAELSKLLNGASFELVSSKDWWVESFSRSGSWDAWVWDTVLAVDYSTRKPRFAGFIVCEPDLGRANAAIVAKALQRPKTPVLAWDRKNPISLITNVIQVDSNNWKSGWFYMTTALGA